MTETNTPKTFACASGFNALKPEAQAKVFSLHGMFLSFSLHQNYGTNSERSPRIHNFQLWIDRPEDRLHLLPSEAIAAHDQSHQRRKSFSFRQCRDAIQS